MSNLRTAAQQALEALDEAGQYIDLCDSIHPMVFDAADALKAALKEPEQEPVAWMFDWDVYDPTNLGPDFSQTKPNDGKTWTPLYTHPPRREWRGLTEEDMIDIQDRCGVTILRDEFIAIEAALKEKNHE